MPDRSDNIAKREVTDSGRGYERVSTRARRRMMVRYGIQKTERTAFTKDISETGLFIKTNAVFKPGTTIQVAIEFPDQTFTLWARVVWAKKVPGQLAHILDCGMGVCFIDPPADWISFCKAWKAKIGIEDRQ